MPGLERFIEAQRGVYGQALQELRRGFKTSHWMWFVFPQIAGLGRSATARHFGIRDLDEARAYLAHDVLGSRLHEATAAVTAWAGRRTLEQIFGAIDAIKFVSSMTLFEAAADPAGAVDFARALDSLARRARDRHTLDLIAA
jgi:uncharacterized protein (DUF1810 family)